MDDIIDLLKIKIEKAKIALPVDTQNAIAAVDWRAAILGMREKKGYTFEQLGDLELETELVLCGLLAPEDYPRELESRMGISRTQVNELVNEMNDLVFKKIRDELIKNTERKKIFAKKSAEGKSDTRILESHGIKIIEKKETLPIPGKLELEMVEKPKSGEEIHPILAQKLSGSFQAPMVKTEHTLENITKTTSEEKTATPQVPSSYPPKADPYRLSPED